MVYSEEVRLEFFMDFFCVDFKGETVVEPKSEVSDFLDLFYGIIIYFVC